MARRTILFVSRNPVVHQLGGSTTVAINLMQVLVSQGAEITVLVTTACSRSPMLFFKHVAMLPEGVKLVVPGYLRIGDWYVNAVSTRAWGRAGTRLLARCGALEDVSAGFLWLCRGRLVGYAWDLTTPTEEELSVCGAAIERLAPDAVVVNYAFWAPLFASGLAVRAKKRLILMHDMLSARAARFVASGVHLDCPSISEEDELRWLNEADYVLAVQKTEAEFVRSRILAKVLVQPIVLPVGASAWEIRSHTCLFVGTNIQPNVTGIRWFLEQVWPGVLARVPDAELRIAGTVCQKVEGAARGVKLLGVVPSLDEEIGKAEVCIVPLLVGSGIKVKLLEALACGKACVATPVGVQGLEGWIDGAIEEAEDAEGFAAAIVRLMSDDIARKKLEAGARALIEDHFSATSEAALEFARAVLD